MDFRPVRGLVRGVRGSAAFCKVWSLGPGWRDLGGLGEDWGGLGEFQGLGGVLERSGGVWRSLGRWVWLLVWKGLGDLEQVWLLWDHAGAVELWGSEQMSGSGCSGTIQALTSALEAGIG